jgi:hypothetical protein
MGAELALKKFASPPYSTLMEWVPTVRAEVEKVATPDATEAVPISDVPSKYWTLPVAAGSTVTVNVTGCPTMEGFALDASVSPAVPFTLCEIAGEEAPTKVESPP